MKVLPLNALRALAAVYEYGGIRPAARELGTVHSAVSRHIAQLESWLGTRLMDKRPKDRNKVILTAQGEALAKAANASFLELTQAVSAIQEGRSGYTVTIETTPSVAVRWLLGRLTRLRTAHPRIDVSVLVEHRLTNAVTAAFDLGIRMGPGPWPEFDCEPLMDDELFPVMSKAYWEQSGRPRAPNDLASLRLLHDRDPHASWESWRRTFGPDNLNIRNGPRYTSSDLVLRAAAESQGVALARHRLVATDLATGVLLRPMDGLSVPVKSAYWLISPRGRQNTYAHPAMIIVANWLRNEAKSNL